MPILYDCDACGYWYNRKASYYICPMCQYPSSTCCDGMPQCVLEKEENDASQEAQPTRVF